MDARDNESTPISFITLNEPGMDAATRTPFGLETDVPDGAAIEAGPLGAQDLGDHGSENDLTASRAGGTGQPFTETGLTACYVEVEVDADGD